jgi:c-di-GMP-binding flagellar brake protein YcgR
MLDSAEPNAEGRRNPRLSLPAMYTLLRVRHVGDQRYRWTGHIYDISEGGMRFELDTPLPAGTEIEVRGMLPGSHQITFHATGRIVRLHDDEEVGPIRMGMTFTSFNHDIDRQRLNIYINHSGLKAA